MSIAARLLNVFDVSVNESNKWKFIKDSGAGYVALEYDDSNTGATHSVVKLKSGLYQVYAHGFEENEVLIKANSYREFDTGYKSKYGFGPTPPKDLWDKLEIPSR